MPGAARGAAAPPAFELVVAAARNGVIGRDNALPWRLPDDLRRFKAITLGHPVLMGRRTFESIGRALPGRLNIVLTRDRSFTAPDIVVVHTLDEAVEAAAGAPAIMVIGGADIFALALPSAERIHLTEVDADVDGDTHFRLPDPQAWTETARERHPVDERHAYPMSFVTLERKRAAAS